ncbi:MAG: protein kinase [Gemmataceae bacterium]|nr:protein kinase [Gemmataceae bacterium]MDW8264329.1 protein kinase [Gemmataceae bacterium]
MAAPATVGEFLELVRKSGVIDEKRLDTHIQQLRSASALPEDPGKLAGILVRDGILTHFQAEQFLLGKWRRFTIGKYKVLERLGSGGMGSVYLCEHKFMRRRVAVKVLPTAKAEDPSSLERFYREARAVAALDHPNIVRAYDIDQDENLHFLVMEYVDGSSLQDIVKKFGPLTPLRAAHYIRQAANGLQHAHQAGLVHRDIKPGNLLVDRNGVVKILDMGLARFFRDEQDALTKKYDENVLGTADYLAPEQAIDSHAVDIRADIYSLGATFYFTLTGSPPFAEGTVAQKLIWHQTRQPKPIRSLRPEVPEGLAAIIEKMMAKDPKQRYQTPAEVSEALAPWTAKPIPPPSEAEMPRLSPAAMAAPNFADPGQPIFQALSGPASSLRAGAAASGSGIRPPAPTARNRPDLAPSPAPSAAPAAVMTPPNPANGSRFGGPNSATSQSVPPSVVSDEEPANAWQRITGDTDNAMAHADTDESSDRPDGKRRPGRSSKGAPGRKKLVVAASVSIVLILVGVAGAWWMLHRPPEVTRQETAPEHTSQPRVLAVGQSGAFKTIREALHRARPKDVVYLQDEVHVEQLVMLDAKQVPKGITIQSHPDLKKRVLWKAPQTLKDGNKLLYLGNVAFLTIKNVQLDGDNRVEDLVTLHGLCPGLTLEDAHLRGFSKSGVKIINCAGESNHPVRLRHLRVAGGGTTPETALNLDVNPRVTRPPYNQFIAVEDCSFEGPFRAVVELNGSCTDLTFARNRFFRAQDALLYNKQKVTPCPDLKMTLEASTFSSMGRSAIWFARLPDGNTSRLLIRNNLFTEVPALAKVDLPPQTNVDAVELKRILNPTPAGNVRDAGSKEDNVPLQAQQMAFQPLPKDPANFETFLRYPQGHSLAKAGLNGGPVGVPPNP